MSFIERIKQRYGPQYGYGILEGDVGHVITHEIIDELIVDRVGFLKGRFLPSWKKEGYCEYSASHYKAKQDTGYSLENMVNRYSNGFYDDVGAGRKYYVFSKILVEYLLTVRNMTFDELIESTLDEGAIFEEVHDWTKNKLLVE